LPLGDVKIFSALTTPVRTTGGPTGSASRSTSNSSVCTPAHPADVPASKFGSAQPRWFRRASMVWPS
jgi:hypothetical protein